jgi:hypothetical protein
VAKKSPYWSCRGCGYRNLREHRNCRGEGCKRTKPKKRVPKHAIVLRDSPYEEWVPLSVEIHGGEEHACGCCRRLPTKVRRHDRDHDHRLGIPRGLACSFCNRERLRGIANVEEARMVLAYFERVEKFYTVAKATTKPEGANLGATGDGE